MENAQVSTYVVMLAYDGAAPQQQCLVRMTFDKVCPCWLFEGANIIQKESVSRHEVTHADHLF